MSKRPIIDPELYQFATPRQAELLKAWEKHGTQRKAAAALEVRKSLFDQAKAAVKKKAARQGYAPDYDLTKPVPEGQMLKGASTLYDAEGNLKLQWIKTTAGADRLESLREAFATFAVDFEGLAPSTKAPKGVLEDVLCVYPLGDPHIGMYAWVDEAGEDFDCDIAERDLSQAMRNLVDSAPKAAQALIANLGDFFHADNFENSTRRNHNALDVDTRYSRVLQVGVRVMRRLIEMALKRHGSVKVINAIGNHDDQSSLFLSLVLDAFYRSEPRVEIETLPNKFHYHRFGQVLFGVTHGDTVKPAQLGGIMTADCRALISSVKHCHWMIGHIHNRQFHEFPECTVESFRTLAPKDAWHQGQGYRSGREMQRIDYHKDWGEQARHRVDISRIKAGAA